MAPAFMRSATSAHCTRSPRYLGNSTPRLTAPTWCPARPTRCSPAATVGGDSTWTTRSTAPMSMPSSRLEVATTAGSRPLFSASSTMARCSRETEPWWAAATGWKSPGSPPPEPAWAISAAGVGARRRLLAGGPLVGQLVEPAGEPLGQPAGVGEDDRAAVGLDQVEHPLLDGRPDRGARLVARGRARRSSPVGWPELGHVLDRDDDREVPLLPRPGRDDAHRPAAGEEGGDLLDRADGGRQPDPLGRDGRAARRAGRGRRRGGRRACCRRPRAPRRRSPSRRRAATRGRRW